MQLCIATTNQGKIIEVQDVLRGLPLTVVLPRDVGITDFPHETGSTFDDNALQKAMFCHEQSGLPSLADDSGIIVDALRSELGIHTRRWGAGPDATDEEWIAFFLHRMSQEPCKTATFHCSIAFVEAGCPPQLFRGSCRGSILPSLDGPYLPGLPISSCFEPDGSNCSYSAMGIEEKQRISHRGKALRLFRDYLMTRGMTMT